MNNQNNNPMTATEWSKQYVQEWLVEGETELWAGQSSKHRGNPVVSVVHCSSFDGEPACIEVRLGKRVHSSVPATRNWQNERRAQVKAGMLLAGRNGYQVNIDTALEAVAAKRPTVSQQVAELAGLVADRLAYENGSWDLLETVETAKAMAWTVTSGGPQALRDALEQERSGKNQREMDHECDARETVAIYSRF